MNTKIRVSHRGFTVKYWEENLSIHDNMVAKAKEDGNKFLILIAENARLLSVGGLEAAKLRDRGVS